MVLDAGSARVDDDPRLCGRDRPMDNWCSAARGVGVSGGYIDICSLYRRLRLGGAELAARRLDQSRSGGLCGLALHCCSSYRGLHPRTVGAAKGRASAPGTDIVGPDYSRGRCRVLGLLLATPLVAAAIVIIRMVYVEDVLGAHTTTERSAQKNMASCGDSGGDG